MITISGLEKSFGDRVLFEQVDLQLNAGSRYGVVGANGGGKSTFLRILMGEEHETAGAVAIPKSARVGMLRQDRFLNDEEAVVRVAMRGDEAAFAALDELERLAQQDDPDPERLGACDEVLHATGGYGLEARASQILVGLGVDESSLREPLGRLSGGYKLRVLLAQALVGRPDALFLDEPTNHLDIVSIRWLEKFLLGFKGCAVVVSHDHRFLNDVATHILDVDYGTIQQYPGNYDAFLASKVETRDRKEAEVARVERAIEEKKASLERFKAKATKARQANSRLKQLERIEIVRLQPSSRRYPTFGFPIERPSGKDVLELKGLCKAFREPVLRDVSLTIRREERVAIIGANGLGKSTLLKIATGRLKADAGEVRWGHETKVGYFAQDHRELLSHPEQSAHDYLWGFCPEQPTNYVRGVLGRLLFTKDEVDKKVGRLSGGEAARLVFGQLAVERPNVLILDEPTNHLDLEAIEALVEALSQYEGTLIFVSHDRWFVSKLANRIVELTKDGVRDFKGTYDEHLERFGQDHLSTQRPEPRPKDSRPPKRSPEAPAPRAAPAPRPAPADPEPQEQRRRTVRRSASTR
ncbi:MAG: ABC-F family ATP-binding cassette domain-containing protein [Polyangiaceae bacterium]|jgi:ATPase subunit of ABC transporter with duplicated ATPase domains|nr:ABC-F family ATP-binding cassette domain-containing protein [Polyangiaceae bacterium]MBK8940910.1 ABC-F family ATP-binding cassette domain-containing protein [Polyangiaceae bacterium]